VSLRASVVAGIVAASALGLAGAAESRSAESRSAESRSDAPEPSGKGYFRRHLWHLVTAFGTNLASNEYQGLVGTSTDPLIFSDPPGFDRSMRNWLGRDEPTTNFVLEQRTKAAVLMGAGAIVLSNLGREHAGRWMADDATGFLEVWYFDKGATELAKNIFGRQRPELEFVDDDPNVTAAQKQELLEDESRRHSFWSGATSRQFAIMSYLDRVVSARVRSRPARVASFAAFYAFASYVGYSRVAQDEHYMTDVIAGAAAGILTARAFYRAHHPPDAAHESGAPRVALTSFSAARGGVTVMFSIRTPSQDRTPGAIRATSLRPARP